MSSRGLTTGSKKNKKKLDPVVKPQDDICNLPPNIRADSAHTRASIRRRLRCYA
ncbi:MAG: palindromic element RPE4 domain-containing protein [Rickettsia endosymbiont of Ecitomorpha arachnoides]|nr:palindromic element RPE4 domain-containing protein [Rickettsia endosymbiont of Ecitomorpha arachnoides]